MKTIILLLLSMSTGVAAFSQLRTGQQAPEISLRGINDTTINLSALRGKIVLVDFWASWCGPCRKNNPRLVKLYKKYHEKGLEILSISIDENEDDWKQAVQKDKLNWLHVIDKQGRDAVSATTYRVEAIPSSFLIGQDGIIRGIDLEGWALESQVKSLLKN